MQSPLCNSIDPSFLLFSSNVPPLVYYSHFFAIAIALIIGLFVLFKDRKSLSNRILFFVTLIFSLWVFLDSVFWASNRSDVIMFVWSLTILFEPLVHAGSLYLMYVIINKNDMPFKTKLVIGTLYLPLIIFVPTSYILSSFDLSICLAKETLFSYYTYIIETLFTIWIIIFAIKKYRSAETSSRKKEILYLTIGIVLFLIAFSWGAITGSFTEDWNIAQWGLIGMPIFIGFLAYSIVKFHTLNVKLIATQALVWGLIVMIGAQFFFIKVPINFILNSIGFLAVIILGQLVVKSVKKEIEQREHLEVLRLKLEESNIKLEDANDKLKDLDKLKTEFLSLASHQLRSPLTAIKGYASMILEGDFGEINPKAKESVDRIFQSSQNLTKVVEDFLNVSKIEQGGMKFEMAPFDLSEVVSDMTRDLSITAEKRGIKMSFETDREKDYMVNGDKEKIRQVVLNLIDNSIKYTKEGNINVTVKKSGDKVVFAVKDTGMGMTPEIKASLFQKFARGEGAKMNTSGSGLGLYLGKEIVEAHKGKIWVESEGMGKGSQFYMELDAIKS